ncbi:MAG TPA: thiamine pyrophosphate-dependent dehydrogenase E1 component subunit alpha [Caulobacteraceae bacterium]|jgi:pyruvate dehydrogenase E1 component alpha subunit
MDRPALLRAMKLIRAFEAALMARPDHGFQLLSSGQEAVSVGVCAALSEGDRLLCSGRAIAPALARGLDPARLMAELLGRESGYAKGRGGRGHVAWPDGGFFGAHAVVGGNIAVAAGVAMAAQLEGAGRLVVCLFGDGACGAGALHETLNIAALWKLPLLFVCDNNQLSIATPVAEALAPARLADLAAPFGIPARTVDGMDVDAVAAAAADLSVGARSGAGPAFLECVSERFATHSTATRETRSPDQMATILARCPIAALEAALLASGDLAPADIAAMDAGVAAEVAAAERFAEASPWPDPAVAFAEV